MRGLRMWAAGMLILMALSACQSMTGETVGQNIDDTNITAAVKTKLATGDKASTLTRINVDTVRGAVVPPAHSFGWREHKSIHPIGGEVAPASGTWVGRSDPAMTEDALMAHASSAVINTVPDRRFKRLEIAIATIMKARKRYCAS